MLFYDISFVVLFAVLLLHLQPGITPSSSQRLKQKLLVLIVEFITRFKQQLLQNFTVFLLFNFFSFSLAFTRVSLSNSFGIHCICTIKY